MNHCPITRSGIGIGGQINIVQYPIFKIKLDIKGLEDILFTQSSELTNWPNVSTEFSSQNAILQSAQEAAAFGVCAGTNVDNCLETQLTRTTAIYFKRDSRYFVAFDDIPDEDRNLALKVAIPYFKEIEDYKIKYHAETNPKKIYDKSPIKKIISLPQSDQEVKDAIERAEDSNRLI